MSELPEAERLSADDRATEIAEQLAADALRAHRVRREREAVLERPGTCTNCHEPCLPTAVYCDVNCRSDHERRLSSAARTRGSVG